LMLKKNKKTNGAKAKTTKKKKDKGEKKIPFFKTKKGKVALRGAIAGIAIMILGNQAAGFTGMSQLGDLSMIGGIIVAVMPIAMLQMAEGKRQGSIDRNLPIFLLAVSGGVKAGKTLLSSIESAADRNMGSLTPELINLRANLSWGMPVEEAFANLIKKVNTRMASRVIILLQQAMNSGGDVATTIDTIQHHVSEMSKLEKERKAALQPYIFTIYISFAVFLGISLILVTQFFTEVELVKVQLQEAADAAGGGADQVGAFGAILGVDVPELVNTLFHMTLVESVFGGLAAGKIGEASFTAGVKHIVILVVLTVIAFMGVGAM